MKRIHFEVISGSSAGPNYFWNISKPSISPSFVLVHDYGWNDYSYKTTYRLFFFNENEEKCDIGELKLMCKGQTDTDEVLPKVFDQPLDNSYCSLGQSIEYYQTIYALFKEDKQYLQRLMCFLRDCSFDSNIREQFEEDNIFDTSLLRDLAAEKALRLGKYIINGINPEQAYSFKYEFCPPYANNTTALFCVSNGYNAPGFARTKGIIGENGKGKTQLLKKLVSDLVSKDESHFDKLPLFGSCLAICSTPFDCFQIESQKLPFISYTLEQNDRTRGLIFNALEKIISRPMVKKQSMREVFLNFLTAIFVPEIIDSLFVSETIEGQLVYSVNNEFTDSLLRTLSSGQLHEFLLISSICANIHLSSLIVIDEPEVHLHPRYIVRFMSILGNILQKFESYAIIATHSPLIIREIPRDSVYIVSDVNGEVSGERIPLIGTANFNTFGEDVSKLYFEIFNYDERESVFFEEAERKARELTVSGHLMGKDTAFRKIVEYFERFQELSTTGKMTIRDIVNNYWSAS